MQNTWTLEEAERNFGIIAKAAYAGEPQYVKNGSLQDLVIAAKKNPSQKKTQELQSDKNFIEFLLSSPQGEWELAPDKEALKMREMDF